MKSSLKVLSVLTAFFIYHSAFAWGLGDVSGAVQKTNSAQTSAQASVDTAKGTVQDPAAAAEKKAGVDGTVNTAKTTVNGATASVNQAAQLTHPQPARVPASSP